MNATFTARGGADPVSQFQLAVDATKATQADYLWGGSLMVARIRERTLAGVDVDGQAFTPYSPAYERKKSASVGGGVVNLFGIDHHTHMLNALQVITDGDGFAVGIYSNAEIEQRARVHNEGLTVRTRRGSGNGKPREGSVDSFEMPQRHWLDANAQEIEEVNQGIGERIDERLRRLM